MSTSASAELWAEPMPPRTTFFLAGAPRCGTTALARALSEHKDVCFSVPKETHFFALLPAALDTELLKREFVEKFFDPAQLDRKALGEASVSYLYSPTAIRAIDQVFPDSRFLIIIRNPLEMLPSYHAKMLFMMEENEPDFETAWRLQDSRASGFKIPRRCRDPRMLQYREIGRLGFHVANLFSIVQRSRVKVIRYEDFARAPIAVYREVVGFLGLDDDDRSSIPRINGTKSYRSALLHELTTRPPGVRVSVKLARMKARDDPPLFIRALRVLRKANVKTTQWRPLSAAMRDEIVETLRDDVLLLSSLVGRDLRDWFERPDDSAAPNPRG
jgi:hypothetical protein